MQSEVYFENIKQQIQTELSKAKDSVFVAVAWLTDDDLFKKLIDLSKKGILIQLILNEDEINDSSGLDYPILFRNGGMVYFVNADENLMHNKFCIIDNKTVLNGSYNWTRKANSNLENLTIIRDAFASNKFIEQFESLKEIANPYFENIKDNHPSFVKISEEESLGYEQLIGRAEKRKENGNYLASLIDLKKAMKINPEKELELLFEIAYCQAELEDNENAIENYTKYLTYHPESPASLNNRGLLYKNKDTRLAYQDFSKAIELEPNKSLYYSNRAELSKKFISTYKKEIEGMQTPGYMPLSSSLLLSSLDLNTDEKTRLKWKENENFWNIINLEKLILQGVEDYLTIIKLDEYCDKWYIYSKIGEIYHNFYDQQKSIEYYTKAIAHKPDYHYGYYVRGWSNYIIKNFEKAVSDIEIAIKINPNVKVYIDALKKIKTEKRKPKNWFK